MKRDMDLIRKIALATLEIERDKALTGLPNVDDAAFAAHVQWMTEAGLLHAALQPENSPRHATRALVFRLTWAGCEFADSVRSNTLWERAKSEVLMSSASWTFGILTDWIKGQIVQGLGKIDI